MPADLPIDLDELEVLPHEDDSTSEEAATALLRALLPIERPIVFEFVALQGEITVRFAVEASDRQALWTALRAFYPRATIARPRFPLSESWLELYRPSAGVELGLARTFLLPLANGPESDPHGMFATALSILRPDEAGVVQVLWKPARAVWHSFMSGVLEEARGPTRRSQPRGLESLLREKAEEALVATAVRVLVSAEDEVRAWEVLQGVCGGFALLGRPDRNELVPLGGDDEAGLEADVLARVPRRSGMLLSLRELASIVHLPSASIRQPALRRARRVASPVPRRLAEAEGSLLGFTVNGEERTRMRLPDDIRTSHTHVVGASGTGKSTLLLNLVVESLERGKGLALVDPHGDLVDEVLARVPAAREDDVVLLDPVGGGRIVGWNLLEARDEVAREVLVSDVAAIFERLSTSWGDQMTTVLAAAVRAIVGASAGGTLLDLREFLVDAGFRARWLSAFGDAETRYFWEREFPLLSGSRRPQAPILTRLDGLIRSRGLRESLTIGKGGIDFRDLLDHEGVLLARLSQGRLGRENAAVLGSLLVSKLYEAALGRQDVPVEGRSVFSLYLDEFQEFATPSMASLFSGGRKFGLALVAAHQNLEQLRKGGRDLASSVLANTATRIVFRTGEDDARSLEESFADFTRRDILGLRVGEAIVRVGSGEIDALVEIPQPLPLSFAEKAQRQEKVRGKSLERYGVARAVAEEALRPREDRESGESKPALDVRELLPDLKEPLETLADQLLPGRGGAEHRYLQEVLRRAGEARGFRTTTEAALPEGGFADVALERENFRVACEISVSSSVEEEIVNLRKCLAAGFDRVASVTLRRPFLSRLKASVERQFSREERDRIEFLTPEEFMATLVSWSVLETEESSAGYRVKVSYRPTKDQEGTRRRLTEILARGVRRVRGGKP